MWDMLKLQVTFLGMPDNFGEQIEDAEAELM